MLARRRSRPGVTRGSGSRLLFFRRGLGGGGEALASFGGERLVLRPLRPKIRALVRWRLGDALVGLACDATLLGREPGPILHALLDPLLFLRCELGITLCNADPLAFAWGVEAVPIRLQRRQNLLLLRGQLGPSGAPGARRRLGRWVFCRRGRGLRR